MTNGLSVRQEQGCGWLFYHAKKNRLCLSFYSIQRDCVILEVLALFLFAFLATVVRHRAGRRKCVAVVPLLRREGDLIQRECMHAFRSGWTNLRLFILSPGGVSVNSCFDFICIPLGLLCCGKHNALWPVLGANDLICSSLVFYS